MWNLNLDLISSLLGNCKLPRIAVETGTCQGNGTRALARHFEKVFSIELSAILHQEACARFSGPEFKNVELYSGNSVITLPKILKSLAPELDVFFFLDAHWSGDSTVDWSRAKWKGYGFATAHLGAVGSSPRPSEQCPLLEELQAIARFCKGRAFILIDDLKNIPEAGHGLKDHEFPGEDWSHLSRDILLDALKPRLREAQILTEPTQWLLTLDRLVASAHDPQQAQK